MPIPQAAFTNSVQPTGDTQARLQPADYGAAGQIIAKATQGFGQDLQQTAGAIQDIHVHDATVAATNADNLRTQLRQDAYYNPTDGFFNLKGQAALDAGAKLGSTLKSIDDKAATLLANNPLAQRMYNKQTMMRNMDEAPLINKHLYQARFDTATEVDSAATEANTTSYLNNITNKDPDAQRIATQSQQAVLDIAERTARRNGMTDPAEIAHAQQAAMALLVKAGASKIEQSDPRGPQAAIEYVNAHADSLPGQAVSDLTRTLAPGAAKVRAMDFATTHAVWRGQDAPSATSPADPLAPLPEGQTSAPPGNPSNPAHNPGLPGGAANASNFKPAAIDAAVWSVESGGKQYLPSGKVVTSGAGAQGIGQVMPKTGGDPGLGVKPMQNSSQAENQRFSHDYMQALIKRYDGDLTLATTAYNWGFGNVDAHIKSAGDPRTGAISDAAWANSIPPGKDGNTEARDYSAKVLSHLGASNSINVASSPKAVGDTATLLQTQGQNLDLPASLKAVEDDPHMTWLEKDATKDRLIELSQRGKQAEKEGKTLAADQAWDFINKNIPNGQFTSMDQLPLDLRSRIMTTDPELYHSMQVHGAENQKAIDAKQTTQDQQASLQALQDFRFANPGATTTDGKSPGYLAIDIRQQFPKLSPDAMREAEAAQHEAQQQASKPAKDGAPNLTAIRENMNRYIKHPVDDTVTDMKVGDLHYGPVFDDIVRAEKDQIAKNNGKAVTQEQRDAIVHFAMSKLYLNSGQTVPVGYNSTASQQPGYTGGRINTRTMIKQRLTMMYGKPPSDAEVEQKFNQYNDARGQ